MDKVYHEPLEIQIFIVQNYTPGLATEITKDSSSSLSQRIRLSKFFSSTISFFKRCKIELKSQANNNDFLALSTSKNNIKLRWEAKSF